MEWAGVCGMGKKAGYVIGLDVIVRVARRCNLDNESG